MPWSTSVSVLGWKSGVCRWGWGLGLSANSCNNGKLCEGHDNKNNHSSDNVCSSAHTCGYVVDGSVARILY